MDWFSRVKHLYASQSWWDGNCTVTGKWWCKFSFVKLCFCISWTYLFCTKLCDFRWSDSGLVHFFLHAVFRTQVLQFCVISGVVMQRMLSASPALGGFFSSWRAQYTSTSLLLWGQDPNYKSAGILVSSYGNLLALHLRKAETCPWRKLCALVQNQTFCEWLLSARWCAPDYLLFKKLLFWTMTQDWTPSTESPL